VIGVELTNGKNEIIIANAGGRAVRFDETQVRPMGRTATGVQSIVLDDDPRDGVVGMCIINDAETESIMVLSENGFGKRTDVEEYRKTSRHAKGVKTLAITEKTGYLVAITVVKDEDDLMIINKSGTTIRLHADVIKETKNRVTQGTKVIELKKRNDVISHLSVVPRADDEPETPAEDETPEQ
jgi:DNA gyrase subunit A